MAMYGCPVTVSSRIPGLPLAWSSRLQFISRFPGYNFPVTSRLDSSGQKVIDSFAACVIAPFAEQTHLSTTG